MIEELLWLGGGYGLFTGCAADDTAAAVVLKVSGLMTETRLPVDTSGTGYDPRYSRMRLGAAQGPGQSL